jgi:hypothetical protein
MEINHVCSLGGLCHSSQILKRNKLKVCSYPFDWIFSNTSMIIDCIEDGFAKFLDKSYYISVSPLKCKHSYYSQDITFKHHNPLKKRNHYNYYVRCVGRFKQLLKYQEHKLFILTIPNMGCVNDDIKNNIIEFNNKLSKHTSNYTLLVILHVISRSQKHEFTYHDNIHFLELHTLLNTSGLDFVDETDTLYFDDILKTKYTFNIITDKYINI